jgi:hypothetical protein
LRAARVLKITRCRDPLRWYSGMIGQTVPDLGDDGDRFFRSREPSGLVNFVHRDDALRLVSFVKSHQIGLWPYTELQAPKKGDRVDAAATPSGKTCAASCHRLGICQALDDCQDKPCIDAELAKGQSRAHSMAETLSSIAVGFVVAMALQALVLPAFGHHITLAQNFWITCIFTVASVLRGYGMRRLFNRLQHRAKP